MTAVPTLDINALHEGESNWGELPNEFRTALEEMGVVYLVNHGIEIELLEKVLQISREKLFTLPAEVKKAYAKADAVKDFSGFTGRGEEILNDDPQNTYEVKECYDVNVATPKYPEETPEFTSSAERLVKALENLKLKIFKLLAKALDIDEEIILNASTYLDENPSPNFTLFRVLKYPRVPDLHEVPTGAIRCADHYDWDIVTFLYQDMVGGLQVKTKDGKWIDATPVPNSILLNAGEILEVWTRGRIPAVRHQVLLTEEEQRSQKDRYSLAFFTFPDDDFVIEPLPETEKSVKSEFPYVPRTCRENVDAHIANSRGYA